MARSFRRKGRGEARRYVSRLDAMERALVVGLFEQVHELLSAAASPSASPLDRGDSAGGGSGGPLGGSGGSEGPQVQDEFDRIVAGMGAIGQGVSLAGDDQEPPVTAPGIPRDPALERLLPIGNRQDPGAAAEFRAMTEQSLVRRKLANLEAAMAALGPATGSASGKATRSASGSANRPDDSRARRHDLDKVALTEPEAVAVLVSLTDVRLVLADRLGLVTEEDTDELQQALRDGDPDDPRLPAAAVYDFLSWLQESLSLAMLP